MQVADGRNTIGLFKAFAEIHIADAAQSGQMVVGNVWVIIVFGYVVDGRLQQLFLAFWCVFFRVCFLLMQIYFLYVQMKKLYLRKT